MDPLHPHAQKFYNDGCKHRDSLLEIIDAWPVGEYSKVIAYKDVDINFRKNLKASLNEITRWVALLWKEVLEDSVFEKRYVTEILTRLDDKIKAAEYIDELKSDVDEIMEQVFSLLISAPIVVSTRATQQTQHRTHIANTAFIMMWIDPKHPELDDVWEAIRDVCKTFGIKADRADKMEHQGRITDLVLKQIQDSEFLIADLTGERPNVYYEIGYAHALDKRPILYRKTGTRLHFDLSVHNVPEYKNIGELKKMLNSRLEAIVGHQPKSKRRTK